jgi:hypothetical protein
LVQLRAHYGSGYAEVHWRVIRNAVGCTSTYLVHTTYRTMYIPLSHTHEYLRYKARVELLDQELERAHERDRETRRLLAAALERIPCSLKPAKLETRESPPRGSRRHRRGQSSGPVP